MTRNEIFALTAEEKMLYIAQAHYRREKDEIQRRLSQLEMKLTFDKKAGEKIAEQHRELQRRDDLLDREFYGKY